VLSASHAVEVLRVGLGSGVPAQDVAAAEEPLEIRLGDKPFVVIMRTPGADRDLAAGFLLAEQIVQSHLEIGSIRHCATAPKQPGGDEEVNGNVLNVWLTGDAATRASEKLARRRSVVSSSSCGVCGRQSIDDLMEGAQPVTARWTMASRVNAAMPELLGTAQEVFEKTGGLHAAGLFDRAGSLVRIAEDVGRHNAVDKVIGAELLAGHVPLSEYALFVSGRTSFEILQKALVAGIPLVASVSAPSSLAIDLAREGNVTLLGFVRGNTFNIYAGPERISV
jgi:FdhD protein